MVDDGVEYKAVCGSIYFVPLFGVMLVILLPNERDVEIAARSYSKHIAHHEYLCRNLVQSNYMRQYMKMHSVLYFLLLCHIRTGKHL